MALPAVLWMHEHVTEREGAHRWPDGQYDDSHWEDCTWMSGVEFARATIRTSIPATHAEGELLRDASGESPLGGSNDINLQTGIRRRYGKSLPRIFGFSTLWAALRPGTGAVVAVDMGHFPYGHRLRRFSPSFTGNHRVFVARYDSGDDAWWCDPLAPTGTGYVGERVTKAELRTAVIGTAGQFVSPLLAKPVAAATSGDNVPTILSYTPGYKGRVENAAGARVRTAPAKTAATIRIVPAGKAETWTVVGYAKGEVLSGSERWLARVNAGRWEYTHSSNVSSVTAPPDVAAAVLAATTPLKASVASLTTRLAGVKNKTAATAADIAND